MSNFLVALREQVAQRGHVPETPALLAQHRESNGGIHFISVRVRGCWNNAVKVPPVVDGERSSTGDGEPPAKKPKNVNLKHWELPPGQLLNPIGQSGVGIVALKTM